MPGRRIVLLSSFMEDFELPVTYYNKELKFDARLFQFGYSYKIEVDVYGSLISFERDEERNWRAVAEPAKIEQNKMITTELIQSLAASLEELFK